MTSRRDFTGGLVTAALGAAGLPRFGFVTDRPVVTATPTVFHGHPDGQTTLVRFVASGVDAPAGRLRVLDQGGRLLGTAGMLRRGDALLGELWLPLTQPVTVHSRLETPVTRGVISTIHRLNPTPRLTVFWLTIADPRGLGAYVAGVPLLARGVAAAVLAGAGVRVNPWSPPETAPRGHLDLLRIAVPAAEASATTGIAVSRIALAPDDADEPFLAAALAGVGVEAIIQTRDVTDPRTVGLGESRGSMARRIEAWLAGTSAAERTAVVVGTDPEFAVGAVDAVQEWNGLYAYPRITIGDGNQVVAAMRRTPGTIDRPTDPTPSVANGVVTARPSTVDVFRPLADVVAPDDPTLAGIAGRFAFPVSGVLVFNPSPFGRSDVIALPDGSVRLATDVPGLGYAFLPEAGAAGAAGVGERWTGGEIVTERYALELSRADGAIVSLVHRLTGRQIVAPGGCLNGLDAAVLADCSIERLPGVGLRIRARRVTPREVVVSATTLYDALPWVDIENTVEGDGAPVFDWRFDLADYVDELRWDVAGGFLTAHPPVERLAPLRWLVLRNASGVVLLGHRNAGAFSLAGSRLTAHGSPGRGERRAGDDPAVRFRLAPQSGYLLADDPWRFGWSLEPLIAVPTSGRGDRALPTFGRMLDVPDPAVAVIGVKPADDGVGVVVYCMDLAGLARAVAVRPGLLTFDGAVLTDLAERDQRAADRGPDGGALMPLAERGYAALRLLGVRLS